MIMKKLFFALSLPLYILDQITKLWVVKNFELDGPGREIIPDFFTLHHIANTGVAFGSFNGGQYSNYIFGALSVIAFAMICLLYKKNFFPGNLSKFAIGLLMGGIMGNLTDRLLHGYVVDFLSFDLHIPFANPWPSFNVADACVVVAAICLAVASFLEPEPGKKA